MILAKSKTDLQWHHRHKIALGAARALRYLHEECRVGCIVHRDMRPNNILLTHDFTPMVSPYFLKSITRLLLFDFLYYNVGIMVFCAKHVQSAFDSDIGLGFGVRSSFVLQGTDSSSMESVLYIVCLLMFLCVHTLTWVM